MSDVLIEKDPSRLKERSFYALVIVSFVFLVIAARLWHLQIMNSKYFSELAANNRIRVLKNTAARGLIYDRNGVIIAENRAAFNLYIIPEDIADKAYTYGLLLRHAGIDEASILAKIKKEGKKRPAYRPIRILEDIPWNIMAALSAHEYELGGVLIEAEPRRIYSAASLATSHMLGYIGEISPSELSAAPKDIVNAYAMGDPVGKFGVESFFEQMLRGIDGGRQIEVDAHGKEMRLVKNVAPVPGGSITLTIDLPTQVAAHEAMTGNIGAVIAIDPQNGKILAMVSAPSFDPNALSDGISDEEWEEIVNNPDKHLNNRTIQGLYPPASTFKPITALAALETGTITPETKIHSGGSFRFGRMDFRDWKPEGHGNINVYTAIVESSDTFFYQVGLKTGVDNIARYSRMMGLGEKSGIELKGEQIGIVPTKEWKLKNVGKAWIEGETIPISVGQGFTLTTPMQLAIAYSAIANGGTIYAPQIIERIDNMDGTVRREFKPIIRGTLDVKPENLELVKKALRGVVTDDGGTARSINVPKLNIAGKTGTAQVKKMKERIRNINLIPFKFRDHALFVGFAPYEDPKIAVAVIVEHGGFGARAAAPVALKVINAYLNKDAASNKSAHAPMPINPSENEAAD